MVLSVMHQLDGFCTVEEIYGQVQRLSAAVDISTVYRSLDLLEELNLVSSISLKDDQHRYKLKGIHEPNIHLVCRNCGLVMEAGLSPAEPFAAFVKEHHHFEIDLEHLFIPGICQACAASDSAVD